MFTVPMQWASMMAFWDSSMVGSLMKPGLPASPWKMMWVIAERRSDSQIPPRPMLLSREKPRHG